MLDKRILIVDDDDAMREALSEALSGTGYQVDAVDGGEAAIELLQRKTPDVMITDLMMPGMSGLELLRRIKITHSELPVILITAYGQIEDAVECMREGASDFIAKPFAIESLEALLEKILDDAGRQDENANIRKRPLITNNKKMLDLLRILKNVANSRATVLLSGESGTGKELLARYVHEQSDRRDGPFVAVNCAAIPGGLLESELFGHERGAFSGAIRSHTGRFEMAQGGTILLDEISEMDMALQSKMLRVLQEFEIERVGGGCPIPLDVRVVASTNRNLQKRVEAGEFRQDLFYRINVLPVAIPPLRQRKDDIVLLARHFVERHRQLNDTAVTGICAAALEKLKGYDWPGNVRELENVLERAALVTPDEIINPEDLLLQGAVEETQQGNNNRVTTLREMEKQLIIETLGRMDGNRTHASRVLGISVRTLRNKLREYRMIEGIEEI